VQTYREAVAGAQRRYLQRAIRKSKGWLADGAKIAGLHPRTFSDLLHQFKIEVPPKVPKPKPRRNVGNAAWRALGR
jgi:transcriptional regulator with GAF, ATPase, and Fis domain